MGHVGVDEEGLRGSSSSAGQVFEPAGGSEEMKEEFVCTCGWMSAMAVASTLWF